MTIREMISSSLSREKAPFCSAVHMPIDRAANFPGGPATAVSHLHNPVNVVSPASVDFSSPAAKSPTTSQREQRPTAKPRLVRSTAFRRTRIIALLTVGHTRDNLKLPVISAVVNAIGRSAKENHLRVLLDEMPDLSEISSVITNREVDGAIVMMDDQSPLSILGQMNQYVPIVRAMGGQAGGLPVDHVAENNIAIGNLAYRYLKDSGCRDIAFAALQPQWRFTRQRGQALLAAAAANGETARAFLVSNDPVICDLYGQSPITAGSVPELVARFAALSPRPTGLFIDRDAATAKIYPLLYQHGIFPGRDVTIISCDNEEVRLSALDPRPASIELGTEEMGYRAVRRLLLKIRDRSEPPVSIQTMPRLCVREEDSMATSVKNISCSDTSFGDIFIKRTGGSTDSNSFGF